jgi:hypothetical protein
VCIAAVMEFIELYGVPMQARVVGENIRLLTQSQDGDTFECTFNVLGSFSRGDFVVFNVCKKMYPFGAAVSCLDDCAFVCKRGMEEFSVLPNCEGVVRVVVSKRVLPKGKRRSVDDQMLINGTFMPFEVDLGRERDKHDVGSTGDAVGEVVTEEKVDVAGLRVLVERNIWWWRDWRSCGEAVIILVVTVLLVVLPLFCE